MHSSTDAHSVNHYLGLLTQRNPHILWHRAQNEASKISGLAPLKKRLTCYVPMLLCNITKQRSTQKNIHTFVSSNAPNVRFELDNDDPELMFEALPARFEDMVQHDEVNDDADPVLVYMLNGQPVAWYDMENAQGYVA